METPPQCPHCGQGWPEEYTFYNCDAARWAGEHRHWKCQGCESEWVQRLAAAQ